MFFSEVNVPQEFPIHGGKTLGTEAPEPAVPEVDVIFAGPGYAGGNAGVNPGDANEMKVPAFWAGGGDFRVRFAPPAPGRFRWRSVCSHPDHKELDGQSGELEAVPYTGSNPLFTHGRLRVGRAGPWLEHADGTPFFWLADTWWMGLCRRLAWPMDFRTLAADRIAKGFTVVQIIAGPYPDQGAFDERGANEAGFPWEADWSRINPSYYDMADLRIDWLVQSGLVPCIVGMWGYYLPRMGMERVTAHWRNLVARYGAYPVVWCLAGEAAMPYYLSEKKEEDAKLQVRGWTEVARHVRGIDPYRTIITIHPTRKGREQVEDPSVLDLEFLQTGHGDRQSLKGTVDTLTECRNAIPRMPVLVSEVCYEGIGEACRQEVQRLMFWSSVLNGAAGHTYGANGIWQVNTRDTPYGPSPHGVSWGNTPWDEAFSLDGSRQLGLGKRLLERYRFWLFEPRPRWIDPHWTAEDYFQPSAAGIPSEVRVAYLPHGWNTPTLKGLEKNAGYRAFLFNPVNGEETGIGPVTPDSKGDWKVTVGAKPGNVFPVFQDWVIVLETDRARRVPA